MTDIEKKIAYLKNQIEISQDNEALALLDIVKLIQEKELFDEIQRKNYLKFSRCGVIFVGGLK